MAKQALGVLRNHLWHLSERLKPLALFSKRVSDKDKGDIVNALKKCNIPSNTKQAMRLANQFSKGKLKSLIGPDS